MKPILGILMLALAVSVSAPASGGSAMVCTKTGTVVASCCCIVEDGAMTCTLTGQAVSSCCCRPVK